MKCNIFRPKQSVIIYSIIIYCYVQYLFANRTGILLFSQIDDLLILSLTFTIIIKKIKQGNYIHKKNIFDLFLLCISSLFLISGYLNKVPVLIFLFSFKSYFIYVLFFYCLCNTGKNNNYLGQRLLKIVIFMFCIQLPFLLFEIAIAIRRGIFSSDSAQGFFGANSVSYAVFFPLLFVSHQYFIEKKLYYLKTFLMLLPVLILPRGEYGIVMYFFIMLLLILFNIFKIFKNRQVFFRFVKISVIVVIIFGSYGLATTKMSDYKKTLLDIINVSILYIRLTENQNTVIGGSGRNLFFPVTKSHLRRFAFHKAIGFGPGMYASYVAYRFMPKTNRLIYNVFNQMDYGLDPSVDSQFIPIWGELGYVGITLFCLFLIYSAIHFWYYYRKAKSSEARGFALTSSLGSLYLLIGFYINHLWEIHTIFMTLLIFWYLSLEKRKEERYCVVKK